MDGRQSEKWGAATTQLLNAIDRQISALREHENPPFNQAVLLHRARIEIERLWAAEPDTPRDVPPRKDESRRAVLILPGERPRRRRRRSPWRRLFAEDGPGSARAWLARLSDAIAPAAFATPSGGEPAEASRGR